MSYYGYLCHSDELYHHGIKGMKWGIRRFQNRDGSYTSAGKVRYKKGELMDTNAKGDSSVTRKVKGDYNTLSDQDFINKYHASKNTYRRRVNRYGDPYKRGAGPKISRALTKSGVAKVADTVNRKTGATKFLTKGIQYASKNPKKFARNVGIASGALVGATAIGLGANAIYKHKKNSTPKYGSKRANNYISYRKDKDMINQYKYLGMM